MQNVSIFPDNKKYVWSNTLHLSLRVPPSVHVCVSVCVKERSILACTVEVVDPEEPVY